MTATPDELDRLRHGLRAAPIAPQAARLAALEAALAAFDAVAPHVPAPKPAPVPIRKTWLARLRGPIGFAGAAAAVAVTMFAIAPALRAPEPTAPQVTAAAPAPMATEMAAPEAAVPAARRMAKGAAAPVPAWEQLRLALDAGHRPDLAAINPAELLTELWQGKPLPDRWALPLPGTDAEHLLLVAAPLPDSGPELARSAGGARLLRLPGPAPDAAPLAQFGGAVVALVLALRGNAVPPDRALAIASKTAPADEADKLALLRALVARVR